MDSPRARPADLGRARARRLARRFGRELRIARVNAGLTQRALAGLARVSQQEVSRAETGAVSVGLEVRCRLSASAGHELGWSLFPTTGVRLRDSGQLQLAQAIASSVAAPWSATLEVGVSPGDRRAADILLTHPREIVEVEVERALVDFQAQLRAAQLKRDMLAGQHGGPVRLVIAVPDSAVSRRRIAPFRSLLEGTLPLDSRRIWAALRTGRPLGGDGLLFVRKDRLPGWRQ